MDAEERAALIGRLFAVMTSKLEDACSDAVDGQSKSTAEGEQIARAERIEYIARDIGLIAEAAAAVLRSAR